MIVHGVNLSDLTQREADALLPSIRLLREKSYEVYASGKYEKSRAYSALCNAMGYLQALFAMYGKRPRSFNRDLVYPVRKDADGNRLCRWCQKPVPRKRMSYCSDACFIEVDCRSNQGALRQHVKNRDKGVCAQCGCDTEKIKRVVDYAGRSFANSESYGLPSRGRGGWWTRDVWAIYSAMGFNWASTTHLWEADHIIEFSAGGESSLVNTQTLCLPCHKAKTKQMHADRKFKRTGVRPKLPVRESQMSMI